MRHSRFRRWPVLLLASVVLMPRIAHAYLDPGTGSYILQIIIGTLLGGLFALGVFWRRFAAFVRRLFNRKKDDGSGRT